MDRQQRVSVTQLMTMENRRRFLAGALACAGAAFGPALTLAAARDNSRRIDVHHHIGPPVWMEVSRRVGTAATMAQWSPAKAIEDMDRLGIATGISTIPDLADWGTGEAYWKLIRGCNEYAARLSSDHPGRFGMFACIPLPDIDASLAEIRYAFDTLKADGVFFWTSYNDTWFGDPKFGPVYEELNRRKAVVYTHPRSAACCRTLNMPVDGGVVEWQTDTSRAIAQLVFSGTALKYPDMRVIFSHGGGTMTSLMGRFINAGANARTKAATPDGFLAAAHKLYFDTSLQLYPEQLWPLKHMVGVSQLLFGSDYPMSTSAGHPVQQLRESKVFTEAELRAVNRGNAEKLFPAFAHA